MQNNLVVSDVLMKDMGVGVGVCVLPGSDLVLGSGVLGVVDFGLFPHTVSVKDVDSASECLCDDIEADLTKSVPGLMCDDVKCLCVC